MNSDRPDTEAWGQLVCVTDVNTPPVPISKDFCYIGRNNDSDICHAGNKLVSGKHCYIERDKQGKVWLYDTSTNGTLLNLTVKLSKGECREISHGDEIHLVHKKEKSEDGYSPSSSDIGYMFQDLKALEAETSSDLEEDTQEYSFTDQTQSDPNATIPDIEAIAVSSPGPSNKRKAADDKEETSLHSKKLKGIEGKEAETDAKPCSSRADSPAGEQSAGDAKAGSSESNSNTTNKPQVKEPEEDAIAETLVCIICQEILHDCISLQPCMHSFCSGCYSEWMELSQECPSCRKNVERINKNHIVNNLVEAYLKLNPDKKRPEEDIIALEAKNKITRDMLYPTNQVKESLNPSDNEAYSTEDEGERDSESGRVSEEADSDEYDEDEEDNGGAAFINPFPNRFVNHLAPNPMPWYGQAMHAVQNFFNPAPAQMPVCRQCPQYNVNNNPIEAAHQVALRQLNTADPDEKTYPTAPVFQCRPVGANHVMCFCCRESMPERTREFNNRPDCAVPPQQCVLCYRHYCHAYWGCRRAGCHGCLAKFKDLNFGKPIMNFLLLDNGHESEILKAWMHTKNLSVKDVFAECLARMVTKNYVCPDKAMIESQNGINTPVCYTCGHRNFKELIYLYRRDIPNDDLPENVTNRPDCHWGKNCRTQKSKPEHARRYNHICEQIRNA